jgi:glycosyltransferase involved in cell wall biosynthesis
LPRYFLKNILSMPRKQKQAMRILLISPQPFYEDRGTPIAVRDTLVALTKLGFNVDVTTFPVGGDLEISGVRIVRTGNLFYVHSVPVGLSIRKILLDICLLITVLRLIRKNDYVCIHGVEEGAAIALFCKALFNIPVIYDMQSSMPEQLLQFKIFRSAPGRWLSSMFERRLVRGVNLIIASWGLAPRVRLIQSGKKVWECSFEGCTPRPKDMSLAMKLGIDGRPTIVYTGNFASYQGLNLILDAAILVREKLPEVVFVLVGGTESEISHLSELIKHLNLLNTVKLFQRQSRERIPDYLALADVLILARPSGENAPLKLFDYLKSGKPLVVTDIPAHRAVLSEKTAILVAPEAKSLANGILFALQNPDYVRTMVQATSCLSRTGTDKTLFDTIAEVYHEIIDIRLKQDKY